PRMCVGPPPGGGPGPPTALTLVGATPGAATATYCRTSPESWAGAWRLRAGAGARAKARAAKSGVLIEGSCTGFRLRPSVGEPVARPGARTRPTQRPTGRGCGAGQSRHVRRPVKARERTGGWAAVAPTQDRDRGQCGEACGPGQTPCRVARWRHGVTVRAREVHRVHCNPDTRSGVERAAHRPIIPADARATDRGNA